MQKKHSMLLILGLATITLIVVTVRQSGMSFPLSMRMMNDDAYSEQAMPMIEPDFSGLPYSNEMYDSVTNKMAISQ